MTSRPTNTVGFLWHFHLCFLSPPWWCCLTYWHKMTTVKLWAALIDSQILMWDQYGSIWFLYWSHRYDYVSSISIAWLHPTCQTDRQTFNKAIHGCSLSESSVQVMVYESYSLPQRYTKISHLMLWMAFYHSSSPSPHSPTPALPPPPPPTPQLMAVESCVRVCPQC